MKKTIDLEDPRLTMYAVGEMPAEEVAAFEEELANSPDAKAEVESIREMTDLLRGQFAAEIKDESPATGLSDHTTELEFSETVRSHIPWKRISLGIAAVLVTAIVINPSTEAPTESEEILLAENHSGSDELDFTNVSMTTSESGKNLKDDPIIVTGKKLADDPIVAQITPVTGKAVEPNINGSVALGVGGGVTVPLGDGLSVIENTDNITALNSVDTSGSIRFTSQPISVQGQLASGGETITAGSSSVVTGESVFYAGATATISEEGLVSTEDGGLMNRGKTHFGDDLSSGSIEYSRGGSDTTPEHNYKRIGDRPEMLKESEELEPFALVTPTTPTPALNENPVPDSALFGYKTESKLKPEKPTAQPSPLGSNPVTTGLRPSNQPISNQQVDGLIRESELGMLVPGQTTGISVTAGSEITLTTPVSQSGTGYAVVPVASATPVSADADIALRVKAVPSVGKFAPLKDNPFKDPLREGLSTFSVDVDTASYSNIRRSLMRDGRLPHPDQVRIEEMVNYFDYTSYSPADWNVDEADGEAPFSINLESAASPWNANRQIVRIGLRGAEVTRAERPAMNIAFLLDVSGSMSSQDKLPLVQKTLREFVSHLNENDRVTMVVYAGRSGEVLEPTQGSDGETIRDAIDALSSGGSTAGAAGIKLAYQRARENFIEEGINQVILATDGDFNVGTSNDEELVSLVEKEARSGVFLTVLGFGSGNLNDSMLEKITNKGNGQYHYIDRIEEGRRVLVEELTGTLVPIAKDVKIQVEFNPAKVAAYRLIGYANRIMPDQDFADDTKDAGEIGAGHTVTALYEILPVDNLMKVTEAAPATTDLKYQKKTEPDTPQLSPFERRQQVLAKRGIALTDSNEWLTVKLRYKKPKENTSVLVERPLLADAAEFTKASGDFRFATAVAGFGMTLRGNPSLGNWEDRQQAARLTVLGEIAKGALGNDPKGARGEFVSLIERAIQLSGGLVVPPPPTAEENETKRSVKEKLKELR